MPFRYRTSIPLSYEQQGYVYFSSLLYSRQPEGFRRKVDDLCRQVGGIYWRALLEFVTTKNSATDICRRHAVSRSVLYRLVGAYYRQFALLC